MSDEDRDKDYEAFREEFSRRDERIQRNIEFIVEQQVQFSISLQQFQEGQEERWKKADERWERTEAGIRVLLSIVQSHEGEISAIQEAQARLTESQERTDKQIAETGEQLAETGERVDALVNTVERLITERRNGESNQSGEDGEAKEG